MRPRDGTLSPSSRPVLVHQETLADGTVLRAFSDHGEREACLELQRAVWGRDFQDLTSPALLKIAPALGGVAGGAFAPDGRLDGFVYGLTGLAPEDRSRPLHWSHMLAVRPEARGRDLGFHLQLYQRRVLLGMGIETVRWTFDPLVARNAYLNLARLGARAIDYVRDYYGSGGDSALSAGIGPDRVVVEWRLASPEVAAALEGSGGSDRLGSATRAPAVNTREGAKGPEPLAPPFELPPPPGGGAPGVRVRVEVPGDVLAVRRERPELAAAWRKSTRFAFEELLARGYRVEGFLRLPDPHRTERRRGYYLLEPAPGSTGKAG